eukprot:TRINITY_DN29539_c0_g1_i1.p2 TRINITY_DN29539_c0_g1~~TRINITY_DN29539_c0_g1_i1.p2  ORF type:complete len:163 (+),score=37.64 TRINITY_DN29539_c0_g1_i1:32-520(+)
MGSSSESSSSSDDKAKRSSLKKKAKAKKRKKQEKPKKSKKRKLKKHSKKRTTSPSSSSRSADPSCIRQPLMPSMPSVPEQDAKTAFISKRIREIRRSNSQLAPRDAMRLAEKEWAGEQCCDLAGCSDQRCRPFFVGPSLGKQPRPAVRDPAKSSQEVAEEME